MNYDIVIEYIYIYIYIYIYNVYCQHIYFANLDIMVNKIQFHILFNRGLVVQIQVSPEHPITEH